MKITTTELYQLINNRLVKLVELSQYNNCSTETIKEIDFLWEKMKKTITTIRPITTEQELEEAIMYDKNNIYNIGDGITVNTTLTQPNYFYHYQ